MLLATNIVAVCGIEDEFMLGAQRVFLFRQILGYGPCLYHCQD